MQASILIFKYIGVFANFNHAEYLFNRRTPVLITVIDKRNYLSLGLEGFTASIAVFSNNISVLAIFKHYFSEIRT